MSVAATVGDYDFGLLGTADKQRLYRPLRLLGVSDNVLSTGPHRYISMAPVIDYTPQF
jgi:hypothetical protein